MSIEIRVPSLGESIVDATIVQWLKKPGDAVDRNEPVVELETDKVNVEIPAEQAGVLESITRNEGDNVEVGELLGMILEGATAEAPSQEEARQLKSLPPNRSRKRRLQNPSQRAAGAPARKRAELPTNVQLTSAAWPEPERVGACCPRMFSNISRPHPNNRPQPPRNHHKHRPPRHRRRFRRLA